MSDDTSHYNRISPNLIEEIGLDCLKLTLTITFKDGSYAETELGSLEEAQKFLDLYTPEEKAHMNYFCRPHYLSHLWR